MQIPLPDDWQEVAAAFAGAESVAMHQAWLTEPESGLRPAAVRCGWNAQSLLVYAVLEDDDIFNPVEAFNVPAFQHGDVFEIILRPAGQEAYYEFHVSPRNQRFQLRIPSAAAFAAPKPAAGIPPEWFVRDWQIDSRVQVDTANGCWRVLASIPLARVAENGLPVAGDSWVYSFSRYDYTQGQPAPVLSSTSSHRELSFHRQQEWGELELV
jgi:hypothetical protein